ncbi:Uncharacterised protein [Burkholderia pseudomallei]|nr:Uncharacterised protein [Burkholderia pseudomallei]
MNLPGRENTKLPLELSVGLTVGTAPLAAFGGALTICWVNSPFAACTFATNAFSCSVPLANACDATSAHAAPASAARSARANPCFGAKPEPEPV